MMHECYHRVTS